ncbi:MAG: PAS and helix-turn-helix domain-containing protein [Acidobacteria bacterium]|nr:PAS and helix-turn-helix domain-containing protein [Acidobacteriota bacterium]
MTHKGQPVGLQPDPLEPFTHTDNGVMGVDAQQRIILWNRIAEALLGYPANEVLGRRCYEVFMATDDCGQLACCESCAQITQARKLHWTTHQTLAARRKTGERIRLHILSFCLLSPSHKLSALIHVFWDAAESRQLLEAAAKPPPSPPANSPVMFLSRQERNVLGCLAAGLDTKSIASMLFISPTTARNHIQSILRKLGVHNRVQAVALANHHHWA